MDKDRQRLIDEARTYLNCPFRHQGRSRQGIDCAGLLINICKDVLNLNYDITGYDQRPSSKDVLKELKKHATRIKKEDAIPADIVLMHQGRPTHLALLTDKGIIHSTRQYRKVVEQSIDKKVESEILFYWRLNIFGDANG